MKLTIAADLHLRATTPISRTDNYAETTLRKLQQLIDHCNEKQSKLLIAGDIFDKPDVPIWYLNSVIQIFNALKTNCYAIAGNHDLKFHSIENIKESALWTLSKSSTVDLVTSYNYKTPWTLDTQVLLHPYHFGQEVATLPKLGYYNILMLHLPIFEKEIPFYMKDAKLAGQLVADYPGFDLYITGDIHIPCITDLVINPGSMLRSSKAQKEHKPCFVDVDTSTREMTVNHFDIEEDVWRLDFDSPTDDSFSSDLEELSQVLVARDEKLSYKEVVLEMSGTDNIKKRFMGIIDGYNERA